MTATARMSLGAIFGAVTQLANTATQTMGALHDGAAMLNRTISDAATRQMETSDIDMAEYLTQYELLAAQRQQEFQDNLEDWMNQRPGRKDRFQTTLEQLRASIEARRKTNAA